MERHPSVRRHRSARLLAASALSGLVLLVLAGPASASSLFADGFESGDFSAWSQVQTAGDGAAAVQSAVVRAGAVSAQLSESATSGSKAYVRKTLSASQQELTVTGDFRVSTAGTSTGNVPFFRLLDPGGARVVSIYRQNNSTGTVGLGYAGANFTTTGKLALGTWATISVHVITAGTSSTVQASVNGALVYSSTTASLGTAGVQAIQIGNDTAAQVFTLQADAIDVQGVGDTTPSAPANVTLPTVAGTPQAGQTLTASQGTWTGTQPISYGYQWQLCDSTGTVCGPVTGATGSTYAVQPGDVGHTVRVAVTATNAVGPSTATSTATAVVQGASSAPVNTVAPTITGTPQVGQVLTAGPGDWNGTQPLTFAYAWQRCDSGGAVCSPIGATATTYTLVAADVGKTIRVVVTATNGAGSGTGTSAATAAVQAVQTQPGLVALWHMDETSGTTMADAVGGHTGALHSVVLGGAGFLGKAYGFTGSSYVSVPTKADLNPGASPLTVTIRMKTTSAPATPDWDIIRKGLYTTAGGEWKMEYQPSGQASCGFKGSSGYSEMTAGPAINDGQWHTVQCVKTDTGIKVVVDGAATTKAAKIGTIANTDALPIGARPGSEFFKGSLDEASVQVG